MGDLNTIDLSAPVDLKAAFGQSATLPWDTHFDVDYGLNNWSPELWCDRGEPCEKPQLLPGDVDIDISDSPDSQAIELRTEPLDLENEYPWFGQEDQSLGSEEDFETHDPALSTKRTCIDVVDEASAPMKRRRSSQRNVRADEITVFPPLSGVVSEEILSSDTFLSLTTTLDGRLRSGTCCHLTG